jgi:organic radical activating enzyme
MPLGGDREELEQNRETVIEMAIRYNVRYSTREHIVVWDKKTGI